MRSIPSSWRRRKTRKASLLSRGGPQTPRPVICMAPKPKRFTVISPPTEKVDIKPPLRIQAARFLDHLACRPGARGVATDLGAGLMAEARIPNRGAERNQSDRPE